MNVDEFDIARIHDWLSVQSYWAQGRTLETMRAAMAGSRNYGVFDENGEQVAFARVVTDGVLFGWMADVFVDRSVRGQGAGVALVAGIVDDVKHLGLKRFALFTADAHGLYEKFGFTALPDPEGWMVRKGRGYGEDLAP